MREILFRGIWVHGNKEWIEGDLVRDSEGKPHIVDTKYAVYWGGESTFVCEDECEVIPETLGQYTGLTDKNGKKIFEGDIVRFGKNIYQIIFSVGSFALYDEQGEMISKIGGHNDHCYSFMDLYIECCWEDGWAYDVEIIGNVHDNPELLEVK